MKHIIYHLQCNNCNIKYNLRCSSENFEKDKEKILACSCGAKLVCTKEEVDDV